MKLKNTLFAVFISALLLTLLFYKQGIGINLFIFELLFVIWLFLRKQVNINNYTSLTAISVFIDDLGISATNFALTDKQKTALFNSGRQATLDYINKSS